MLTKDDIKKLQREYPEGIPPEYLMRGYTYGYVRRLMNMRKTPPNDDAMVPEHRLSGVNPYFGPMKVAPSAVESHPLTVHLDWSGTVTFERAAEIHAALVKLGLIKVETRR